MILSPRLPIAEPKNGEEERGNALFETRRETSRERVERNVR